MVAGVGVGGGGSGEPPFGLRKVVVRRNLLSGPARAALAGLRELGKVVVRRNPFLETSRDPPYSDLARIPET